MSWYYSKGGMQLGPVNEDLLREKCQNGEVQAATLVWKEGMADWKPVSEVAQFSGLVSATQITPPPVSGQMMNPQPAQAVSYQQTPIPNYLWQSIVATLFCCMPFGIVAIVYAAKVDSLVAAGDYAGASAASKTARTWVIAAVACMGVIVLLYGAGVLLSMAGAAATM